MEKLNIPPVPEGHVRLHYHRFDGNYDGWGLHLWGKGYAGEPVEWTNAVPITGFDTYGAYWDIPYNEGVGDLNFIIHKGDIKDPQPDREYPNPDENKEIWAVSGDITAYTSRLAAFKAMSNKIESAVIVGPREIEIRVRAAIKEPIYIKDGKKFVPLAKLDTSREPIYLVTVREDLDLTKTYNVEIGKMTAQTVLGPEVIDKYFAYDGELGNFYTPKATTFKLWAPVATDVKLLLFEDGKALEPDQTIDMVRGEKGVWTVTVEGDLLGKFYQYAVTNGGKTKRVLDPYARSMAGFDSNGPDKVGKGAIVDLDRTDPEGWENDTYVKLKDQEDVIIYEISVRDFTIAENSGVSPEKRGTYVGFIEKIPHLVELGITHVQLQPVQNFYYGNEYDRSFENKGSAGEANYNWGYDPHNYNTPEGWYSLNPDDPHLRIKELKQLIKALHDAGIGVILDVVYNHTAKTDIFEDIVPNYYYRRNANGNFTSGSGCGNDTASERKMWRKFMIESTKYWVEEYHVDGFRFDLMGLHDETTMHKIAETLRAINPDIVLHGEGWNMGTLPETERYIKASPVNHSLLEMEHAIAVFNDTLRDAMKHEYFASPLPEGAFLQAANPHKEALIRAGIIAGMVDYESEMPVDKGFYHRFADDPEETITYVNCHDGYTIWDKIVGSTPGYTEEERIRVNKLAAAMILTSQGKAFLHGGEEMLRSKPDPDNKEYGVDHNSYDSGDLTNQIDWSRKEKYADVFNYYKGLIELRKAHEAFRMETMEEIKKGLTFIKEDIDFLIAYRLEEQDGEDDWKEIVVIYNANREPKTVQIDGVDSSWKVVVDGKNAGVTPLTDTEVVLSDGAVTVPAISAVVIYK
ncbi:type I pullulanase [Anoxybacter fermentans]|uniref:pullulanase n=2 Tax=Anoxybacter fermentans TaxID=1323375 RepID=A0A3Q9HSP4_9FIRM|nr:type I pullulanase [Anoxybacter fermentans]